MSETKDFEMYAVRVVDFCPTGPIDVRHNWAAERAAHECRIDSGKLGSGGANSRTTCIVPKNRTLIVKFVRKNYFRRAVFMNSSGHYIELFKTCPLFQYCFGIF